MNDPELCINALFVAKIHKVEVSELSKGDS